MHKLPSFDLVKELVTKLVDPELDLFFSEREEIAKVLTDAVQLRPQSGRYH
jgi:hypothetical protein